MISEREGVQKVRDLLSNPLHWTKRTYARNSRGEDVDISSPEAMSFCLYGASAYVDGVTLTDHKPSPTYNAIREYIWDNRNFDSAIQFNDYSTHKQVIALLDELLVSLT